MTRRDFLYGSSLAASAALLPATSADARATNTQPIDAKTFAEQDKAAEHGEIIAELVAA